MLVWLPACCGLRLAAAQEAMARQAIRAPGARASARFMPRNALADEAA